MARFLRRLAPFCFCVLFAHPASGAVFERDWKTPGDGLLTYDDVNRREWLDLSVSRLSHFSGLTLEDRYQNAISETLPGGLFEGFVVGNRDDVIWLAQSAGIDTTTADFATNGAPVSQLIDLLEPTLIFTTDRTSSLAFVDQFLQQPTSELDFSGRLFAWLDLDPKDPPFISRADLKFGSVFETNSPEIFGVMLYRQVPEPSSLLFAFVAAYGLIYMLARSRKSTAR